MKWLCCIAFGVLMATMPHLYSFLKTGSWIWIADSDELTFYLPTAAQAYFNGLWRAQDPFFAAYHPTVYPSIQVLIGVLPARLAHLGPLGVSLVWRLFGGVTIACGWLALFRVTLRGAKSWVAAAFTLILLGEAGLLIAKPFVSGLPYHPEWRVITPAVSLVFWLFYTRALIRRRGGEIGLWLGLLFWVYFYFWTAALAGLALAALFDRAHARAYLKGAIVGIILGLPPTVAGFLVKREFGSAWLMRSDKFLPIPHLSELFIPKVGLALLLASGAYLWRKRPDLRPVTLTALAGYLLLNHQIVTGLQIENFHWNYAWAPLACFLACIALAERFGGSRVFMRGLATITAVSVGVALWTRLHEVTYSAEPAANRMNYLAYEENRGGVKLPLAENSVIGGDEVFQAYATVLENQRALGYYPLLMSPSVSDDELTERHALSAYLAGATSAEFRIAQTDLMARWNWGRLVRNPALKSAEVEAGVAKFAQIERDPAPWVKKFQVRYAAVRQGVVIPPARGWKIAFAGPEWTVWDVSR